MATPIAVWLTNFRSPEAVTSLDGFFVRMLASDGPATETRADPTGFPYGSERQCDDRSTQVEDGFHAAFRRTGQSWTHPYGRKAVSNLLFFRRSCAYRAAAVELMRKARAMPLGLERRAAHQLARAFSDLAKTEAWLEGQTPRLGSMAYGRGCPSSAVGIGS